jgi:type I restriction enzyme S subunit
MNNLPKGWTENTLKELIKIKGGKRLPKGQSLVLMKTNHPYIRITDLDNNSVKKGQLQFITNDVFSIISRYIVNTNDIILSIVGTVGLVSLIDSYLNNANLTENCVKLTPLDKEYLYYKYFFYYLISNNGQYEINKNTVGAVQKKLPIYGIENIKIYLPSLIEQKAIADILSSFDNKIELLNEQNKTLETMVQAIFKEWFVDNKNDNWNKKPLSEIADFLNGLACQKFPPKNNIDKLPVLKIKELKNGISNNSDWATIDVKNEYIVHSGDVIFAWSASLIIKIWNGEKSLLNQHLFKVTSEKYPKWFYFQWCKYHLNKFISIAKSKATTIGHIKRGDLDSAMCFIPVNNEIQKLDYLMSDIMKKNHNNNWQIQTLQNTRDTLLPKLMNGKLRIKGFEE